MHRGQGDGEQGRVLDVVEAYQPQVFRQTHSECFKGAQQRRRDVVVPTQDGLDAHVLRQAADILRIRGLADAREIERNRESSVKDRRSRPGDPRRNGRRGTFPESEGQVPAT